MDATTANAGASSHSEPPFAVGDAARKVVTLLREVSPYAEREDYVDLRVVLVLLVLLSGCRTFSQRGPVPEAVASCRQLSQQGVVEIEQGNWTQAELLLAQAVKVCDTNAEARRHYAEALWHRGATKEAMVQMEAALKMQHEDAALQCRYGEMCLALGDLEQAQAKAGAALQLDGRLASAWALRGRVQQAQGARPAALADMQRALLYAPTDPGLLLAVAELQREMDHPQRALVSLQQLADLYSPGEEPQQVLYLTGLALSALGRHADAAVQLYAACQRGEPSAELLYRLAEAELLSGRMEAAEANARQALQLNPHHAACHGLLERLATARSPQTVLRQ